jgi:hypothetical protein
MSPADNADALTPLMRLRRRRKAFRVFGTLLILALLLLVGIVLAVNQGRNFHRMVDWLGLEDYLKIMQPAASEAPKRYRQGRVATFPPRLVSSNTDEASAFSRFPSQAAYERCRQLSADSAAMASFQASGDDWECVFSRELGTTPEPSVLFIQARGTSPDSFRTFRAKLSLLDPSQDTELMRLALDSLDRFGLALSPESRRYVGERITMRRNFSSLLENYRISFERERDDEKRFNLLIVPLSTMTTCASPRVESDGRSMSASIAPMRLGCLSLNRKPPISGQSVKPD